jgi:hypothetical protein
LRKFPLFAPKPGKNREKMIPLHPRNRKLWGCTKISNYFRRTFGPKSGNSRKTEKENLKKNYPKIKLKKKKYDNQLIKSLFYTGICYANT